MSTLTRPVTELSADEKRAMLAQLLQKKAAEVRSFPLSFAQQRLWLLDQMVPGLSAYNVPLAVRLSGTLDIDAFAQSLNALVQRHDVFRTTFRSGPDGVPAQVVARGMNLPLPVMTIPDEADVERLAVEEAQRPFDLSHGPLVRATMLRLGDHEHVLLLTLHHIISDVWSLGVLLRDVMGFYEAKTTGSPVGLPDLPIQYGDYAIWQRQWLKGDVLERQLGYWKRRLDGATTTLDLPTDHPRPAVQTFRGAHCAFELPRDLVVAVRTLARREGGTPFMVLLSAFQALLHRYTGQDDLCVGTPIAGRNRAEVEDLIGFFVNTLVLRTDLSGDPTFGELLARVRETCLGAYAHQDLPFERLVEELRPERDLSRSPLFQALFVYQNAPLPGFEFGGLRVSPWDVDSGTAKFDLSLFLIEEEDKLRGVLEYSTELFDPSTAARLVGHFRTLLEAAAREPHMSLSALPMLTAEEHGLLAHWNETRVEYPHEHLLHQLVEHQAQRTPHAQAARFEGQSLSYRELDCRATRLAALLQGLGVRPDTPVAVAMERSLELVVALLGVLKAGGAYVPLDPDYPAERLDFMLRDAAPAVLLTQSRIRGRLPAHPHTVNLDTGWDGAGVEGGFEPPALHPENLAYIIYTSGSTGRPKGAQNTHRAICNRLLWMQDAYELTATDSVLQKTPFSFDVSVWEFFWPLLAGARLVLARPEGHKDPTYLADTIAAEGVTVCHFVPSMLEAFLAEPDLRRRCASLRDVVCSGEALAYDLQERFLDRLGARLHNLYGPTEAAVDVTYWQCRRHDPRRLVPIGRPIANLQMHVLDDRGNAQPVGVPGELHIGGVGLARGYHNRDELTAEKFVEHPALGRLYRTGDLGRWLGDGALEYLGRLDHQVKVRGFRVELGEIEAALCDQQSVRAAVVVAREDTPGDKRLVAYVVPEGDSAEGAPDRLSEQVARWHVVWEETYGQSSPSQDATFNTIGWNSSYSSLPFSDDEMREWLDHTVARILSLRPVRVLEIGCGTGMLLFRIAPHCAQYTGLDFSENAVASLREQVASRGLPHVSLLRKGAHELDGLTGESFDTVIINSVAQYFPGIDYLVRVIEGAARLLGDGGRIFLGDLRNFRLLDAFHASVLLHRAGPTLTREQLRASVANHAAHERELLVDPAFFPALRSQIPAIGRVEVQLKEGCNHNELTRFRYDVVLHLGDAGCVGPVIERRDWQAQSLALADVPRLLEEHSALSLERVPNSRVGADVKLLELLSAPDGPSTADDLRGAIQDPGFQGLDPDEFRALARDTGQAVEVRWSETGGDGCFDVVFRRPAIAEGHHCRQEFDGLAARNGHPVSWAKFANDPLRGSAVRDLVPRLREALKARLPEYMVPSAFVVVDALPLSPNGKIDRKALPAPEQARPELGQAYVAPGTAVEQAMADLWAEVLGVERVGAHDNFFELGGHSLLATQVVSRIRNSFQVELPLRAVFEAPTVAALAERVEAARRATLGLPAAPLLPIPRDDGLPLSFGQETFWFLDQLEPGSPVFNIDVAVRLRGPLDLDAVEQAIDAVLRRHEALRTTFQHVDGRPVAVIAPPGAFHLQIVDLTGLTECQREEEARRLAGQESRLPFDLERGPLFRVTMLRLGPDDHVGLLTVHHSVFDGWSLGVFLREAGLLYQAARSGERAALPDLAIQYADFAHWQRRWLGSGLMEDQLAYWKTQLAAPLPVLELPADRPRPAARSFRGARRMIVIPPAIADAVHALGRREGCTLYMVLLAAFKALLARYCGEEHICVGTPIAGRNRAETEGLIGFFVNTLVLRTDLSGDPSFRDVLGRVREVALEAYAHQDLPFEMLVQELKPERDLSHSSLFQVMFILQNAPLKIPNIAGLTSGPLVDLADNGTSKFDLTLTVIEATEGLLCTVEFNTDLFDDATIVRLLEHYQTLLGAVVADAEVRISRLGLLTPAERRQLEAWGRTSTEYPVGECIHELFEAQAVRTPGALAVAAGDVRLTYDALNRRANRFAHHLRSLGVGPEVPVGVYLDRTPDLLVAILGVLKAGGAYVPLDPSYPGDRLSAVIEAVGAPVLVTQQALVADLPSESALLFCIDEEPDPWAPEENLPRIASAANLAYVIYTSGSTGRPKGVMVEHGSLCNAFHAWDDAYGLRTEVRCHLQMASCAFDVFTGDWVRALGSGGTLVLCPREVLLDPARLHELMRRERVDCAEFVPAVLRSLVQYLEETGGSLASLRMIVAGSDAWHADEARAVRRLCGPRTRLINSYGLTEATIDSTFHEITELDLPGDGPVPIGRPFANTEIHILDRGSQPVPVGVPGELHIGGVGLARGYFRDPVSTASKFIPDCVNRRAGARLFRTGDLARYLPDGTIEWLGRGDDQVKIRGFRIEPGEVEAVLGRHPDVRQAVVVPRGDGPGPKHLVAYVAASANRPTAPELRAFLRDRLPDYMVPSAFVVLDSLPLSQNGKFDRHALPAVPGRAETGTAFIAPRTPVEELVADVWARVLGLERVGAEDNFFDLGGHSLLAAQVISRLVQACQVDLPLRRLFDSPTVAGLAECIEIARRAGRRPPPPLRPRPPAERAPLSFAQQRLWFLDRFEPDSPFYNIPAAARLVGELDVDALRLALQEIVRRHEVLRTTIRDVDGEPAQVVAPALDLPLPLLDLSGLPGADREAEARRVAREQAQRPFDLAGGPVLRTVLVKLAEREHIVVLAVHHIASDGWSMGIFFRELIVHYRAFATRQGATLPPLDVQYADYAAWQRDWLCGEVLDEQLAYWKERLAGAPAALELPTDRPRPAVQTVNGATEPLQLPPTLLADLKTLCRREGCTLHMALLAAFQTLLHRYTGQEDICVGTPVAGRPRPELEGLIGFFVNTLVLRTDLSGDPTFAELLGRVRETALGAYAHQDLPFEVLVEALQPERDLSRTPLFQVMFILQNTPRTAAELPGLSFSPVEADSGTAKFDLTLALAETEDGLVGNLEYNTDLFDPATARRLLGHFRNLLESVVDAPTRRLSAVSSLDAAERRKILLDWNETATPLPGAPTVHRMFEAQAAQTPDAVAVVFEDEEVTYRELNERADRLAHDLGALECCRRRSGELLVGLCVERSTEMVVAMLAILKAGGAYVPLDPAWPPERLAFMLDDAGVALVLTQQSLAGTFASASSPVVCLDGDHPALPRCETTSSPRCAAADDLAYVIYTSGSTGQPKGVEVTHGCLVNFLASMQRQPGLDANDILLAVTTLSFDIAALEIFLPLTVGARVHIVPREVAQDGTRLAAAAATSGATVIQATPATWRMLLEAGWEGCSRLKVLCGGEAMTPELARQLLARSAAVWNLYGPTETTVWSTIQKVVDGTGLVPIGRPIANTRVYVVDGRGQPVPVGVPGELQISGAGVARGYRGRPELTAEKFIPDPFSGQPGSRLYRTGDRARWLSDGTLGYLGRADHQVKIRGFRIEPAEVEAVLRQHPGVGEAVAVAREDGNGEKRLVAYVVGAATRGDHAGADHVAHWRDVWDEAYSTAPADTGFNTSGWNSSYTGRPLGEDEMREWVERTVERIGERRPDRVLEIGCGTGLLLFRLAAHCDDYTATDVSARAIESLRRELTARDLPVTLLHRRADDFSDLAGRTFDAVVLNSVVQYFPSIDYLLGVLEDAVRAVRPGGVVFVGDVRNRALLDAFHAAVLIGQGQAPERLGSGEARRRVRRNADRERELVIDPAFFDALREQLPAVRRAEVRLRRGAHQNEMNAFRYDVILHVGDDAPGEIDADWLDYREHRWSPSDVRRVLDRERPDLLAIANVPNARIPAEALALLRGDDAPQPDDAPVDPEEFWRLGDSLPYEVDMRWSAESDEGRFDVAFRRIGTAAEGVAARRQPAERRPWAGYANDPLRAAADHTLVPSLREHARSRLPDSMVPSAFVVLDALPLTPNGKVDRKLLPAPHQERADWHGAFVAPRDAMEERLAGLWGEVLGLDRVGVHDNFFDLGGHSLQAVQLVSRASKVLGRAVPVKALFLHPTVAAFAEAMRDPEAGDGAPGSQPGVAADAPLESHLEALGSRVSIERRRLLPLFESGALGPADSAAIGYLPSALLDYSGLSARQIIDDWCGNRPVVSGLYQTPMGRIALLLLPRFDSQLYQDRDDLLEVLGQALDTCRKLGARTVSLTGLLPSATGYGKAVRELRSGKDGPEVTSGHATTTAAVVLAVRRILAEAGRDLSRERVGFVGLGSIGTATLRTLLECSPHPEEIRLCDVYGKRDTLLRLSRELADEAGYRGAVHVLESRGELPASLYDSTLIIGATNVPDVLDVDRLMPGTLLVDDSSPHCFRLDRAVERLRSRQDILFTEGGTLHAPEALGLLAYVPAGLEQVARAVPADVFANYDAHQITGCVLSSLLSTARPELHPTIGPVGPGDCLAHLRALEVLGFGASSLHCAGLAPDEDVVHSFRQRFSQEARSA